MLHQHGIWTSTAIHILSRRNANSRQRNLPAKGFRPGILLLGMGAIMGYGWYKLVGGIREAKYVSCFPIPLAPVRPRR